jgi:DNA helicase-2/ATP-dependent DNA helicase PcrA
MTAKTVEVIKSIRVSGYDTVAIICRTIEETMKVRELLKPHVELEQLDGNMEEMSFSSGNMVLPIHMTKGLEFDAVILWNPEERSYRTTDEDAKLMYVAITRAMHELHIIYLDDLTGLLK